MGNLYRFAEPIVLLAIAQLGEALRLNPDLTEWSKQDPDFASIREEPAYRSLYSR